MQAGDVDEVLGVVSDEGEVVNEGGSGDKQIEAGRLLSDIKLMCPNLCPTFNYGAFDVMNADNSEELLTVERRDDGAAPRNPQANSSPDVITEMCRRPPYCKKRDSMNAFRRR